MQQTKTIKVLDYDPNWPILFDQEAAKIKAALRNNCLIIHHIGSTARPGLAAKPVIDIIPVVQDIYKII